MYWIYSIIGIQTFNESVIEINEEHPFCHEKRFNVGQHTLLQSGRVKEKQGY